MIFSNNFNSRDGRIKVVGGDNIEGLLVSPKPLPFKNLEVGELKIQCSCILWSLLEFSFGVDILSFFGWENCMPARV